MKPVRITSADAFGKVAVLMGGSAAEREISLKSGGEVFKALKGQGIDVIAVDVQGSFTASLADLQVDRVFNIVHGRGGEDGVLQGVLQDKKIPVTGSDVLASALAMDKLKTKLCWQGMGLQTPRWQVLKNEEELAPVAETLGFPVIVKPALEGSSLGMSRAEDLAELQQAYQLAASFGCEVYAEQWVQGKEYTVAVLDGEALPVIGLETPHVFYDFNAKYQAESTQYLCPCGLDEEQENTLKTLAVNACEGIGISGWARVDVFIDDANEAQLIEVNTVPGMTDHSLVPMAAKAVGISFDELVWRILETSCNVE